MCLAVLPLLHVSFHSVIPYSHSVNLLTSNVNYSGRTAPQTSIHKRSHMRPWDIELVKNTYM